jgi:hypothetical protein
VEDQQGDALAGDRRSDLTAEPARQVGEAGLDPGRIKSLAGQIGKDGHQQGGRSGAGDGDNPQRIEQIIAEFATKNLVKRPLDLLAKLTGLAIVLAGLPLGAEVLPGIDPIVVVKLFTVRVQPRTRIWLVGHATLTRERMTEGARRRDRRATSTDWLSRE